jgi:hypothetical protein
VPLVVSECSRRGRERPCASSWLGKLLGISAVSAYKWVHASAASRSEIMEEIREMELDDLCNFLYEKGTSIGFEKPMLVADGMVSPKLWLALIVAERRAFSGCAGCFDDGDVYADVILSGQQVMRKLRPKKL